MAMDNVKGVSCSDVPAENYHLTLQFPFFNVYKLIVLDL